MIIYRMLALFFLLAVLTGSNSKITEAANLIPPVDVSLDNSAIVELAPYATYIIEQDAPDLAFQLTEYKKYSGPIEGLASNSEAWTGFYRQQGRDITVDLGSVRTITQISLEFKQDSMSGIQLPQNMISATSIDGLNWSYLGQVSHNVSPSDATIQNRKFVLSFPPMSTRFVKISFPVEVWVFARHLSIKGGLPAEQPLVLSPKEWQNYLPINLYLEIPDIKDILLVYSGDHNNQGNWTSRDFLPMVGYIDRIGVLKGRMFDTMLFLPFSEIGGTKENWKAYMDELFAPGVQLHALDQAVAKVNEIPYLQGKEKVILTLPYPDPIQKNFGSLENGKESLSFLEGHVGREQALENRFLAVQWYYNQLMTMWNKAEFKHLDLVGIYWYKESMDQAVPDEKELLQKVARIVRDNGQDFFWIPYFGANGYTDWKSYDFNYVFLQPNYYANDNPPEERMNSAAELAKRYHLGIELECDDRITYSRYYYDLFYKQLNKAHQLGIDGATTNAYYAGNKTLVNAYRSSIPQIRNIYDDIYNWINGTYIVK